MTFLITNDKFLWRQKVKACMIQIMINALKNRPFLMIFDEQYRGI